MKLPHDPGRASYILLVSLAIVFLVSLLPLGRLSGGVLRDFSLIDDILSEQHRAAGTDIIEDEAPVDSALTAMQRELEAEEKAASADAYTLTIRDDEYVDSVLPADTASVEVQEKSPAPTVMPQPIDPRRDGYVAIEDYTPGGTGISRLRDAFSQSRERCVRVAFVGDSYIEGDIFTQDVRSQLQDIYGGAGVGYVNMYSEFPGFRRSVRQSGSGWNVRVAGRKGFMRRYAWLSEQYSVVKAGEAASASYSGVKKVAHASAWSRSTIAFWAPAGGTVRLRANGGAWDTHTMDASEGVRTLSVDSASVRSFEVSVPAGSDVTALGVWLDSYCGVAVDCMSSRGFSGVTLRDISPEVCRALTDAGLGYDFIVLEFGINAMSAGQTDYTSYGKLMAKVVEHIRNCYPNAVIMLMGIGDRGQKQGAEVRSMPSAVHMVDAQRQVARATGILFWDTREAMGGNGAIVSWAGASPPRANKDYIHLNHHGGAVLATEFVKSLKNALNP
ncbi:GDSL-type esterase/lipase family protein [Muribaculum intestinale]|uniref:GDSL-type esterase/lipase family protein n=1 Tax=Muribaculum intestinale TaxID=1796646 RepID=UPI00242CF396|nr:GDSL-type esterase/lipase family protein [Muribaculum intestinale]